MSAIRPIVSPDERYEVRLASHEMRMSHWVTSASLWERHTARVLLHLGDGLWSSEKLTWSADSRVLRVDMRRYPGDAPDLVLDIYPEQQIVIPRAPIDMQPLPFTHIHVFLDLYYAQYRWGSR